MTKTEMGERAKDVLQEAIGQAYYLISEGIDGQVLTEQEKERYNRIYQPVWKSRLQSLQKRLYRILKGVLHNVFLQFLH